MGTSPFDCARTRRILVALALLGFAQLGAAPSALAEERRIELYNIHTKEDISIVYKRNGEYIPAAMKKLNHFMRDWRRDEATKMDPELIDIIWSIHDELGSKKPVHLISGYRSPKTNAMLRRTRGGQATKSKHMTGQAADIHFPDISAKQLRNSALVRQQGGVGYYPTSAIPFVHVDTGRVRHWPRLPRQELAILFPEGKSKHIPSDGKPITKKDFKVALRRVKRKGGDLPVAVERRLAKNSAGRTILASLTPNPKVPVPTPAPDQTPRMVFASLTPMNDPRPDRQASSSSENAASRSSSTLQRTAARSDPNALDRNFSKDRPSGPSATVPSDQMASAPSYDDDHPDELNYQPFRVLPLMTEHSVASVDLSQGAKPMDLRQVHMLFGESQQMLMNTFEPGLQYAGLYGAQRFQGKAVNTKIERLVRKAPPEGIETAQRTRTAQR